jgi:hypothetical protein
MRTLLVVTSVLVALGCGSSREAPPASQPVTDSPSHGMSFPYPVLTSPGLVPTLTPKQVVSTVPGPFGGGRVSGEISEVQLVAFIRACQLPLIDPRVSPPNNHANVWYVRFSGTFHGSALGHTDHPPTHEAYYLVSDRTGAVLQRGTFSSGSAPPPMPEPGRLTSGCS